MESFLLHYNSGRLCRRYVDEILSFLPRTVNVYLARPSGSRGGRVPGGDTTLRLEAAVKPAQVGSVSRYTLPESTEILQRNGACSTSRVAS